MVIIWGSILNIKQKNWISTNIVYYGWLMLILHPMIFHHIHHCPIFNWFNHSNHLFLRWTQVRSSHPIRYRWGSKQSPSSPSKRGSLSACQSCAKVRLVLRRLRLAMKSVGWFYEKISLLNTRKQSIGTERNSIKHGHWGYLKSGL